MYQVTVAKIKKTWRLTLLKTMPPFPIRYVIGGLFWPKTTPTIQDIYRWLKDFFVSPLHELEEDSIRQLAIKVEEVIQMIDREEAAEE